MKLKRLFGPSITPLLKHGNLTVYHALAGYIVPRLHFYRRNEHFDGGINGTIGSWYFEYVHRA